MRRVLRRLSSVWGRLVLACGILLAPATMGTMARWNDSGSAQPAPLQAGAFDLLLDGQLAGPGGSVSRDWSAADLVPGEFRAFDVAVGNGGQAGFTYSLQVVGESWGYSNAAVVVQPHLGTANPNGTCSGGSIGTNRTIPAAGPLLAARALAPGASESVCLRIGVAAGAPSSNQGASGTLRFTFDAMQQDPNP